ncbi:MAG TPA: GNVR domain-containing protein [Bryobacteraceae bacterium]|nr:GNVR domain-containing protein [Bryobacteraceae bacterium]
MLRRYRSWIIGPMFAGLVIAVVVAFLWPDTYVSSATLRITPQQVPERLVPSNINTQIAQRLTAMQQEILSRTSLSELIQRPSMDLYKKERLRTPMEDVVENMRKDIRITILDVPTAQAPGQGRIVASAFQISFAYPDRYKAQAVVRELVTKFTEQNVQVQRNQAKLTTNFLADELKAAKADLDQKDAEITAFKQQNAGRLPEQMQSNMQTLNSLQMQLASVNEMLNRNAQEKMMLETQVQNLKSQENFVKAGADQNAGAQTVKNERLIQVNRNILDTETALAAARQVYKEDYPDVRTLKARLDTLKRERDSLEKQQEAQNAKAADGPSTMNPQVAKSLEDIKANLANVQAQIQAKNLDIQERTKQQTKLNEAISAFQARIEAGPVNEQRYAALMRDYQIAKQNYDDLAKKKDESETATNLEERKAGENLEVLDPASLPEQPSEPNRLLIAGVGIGSGLLFGLFMAGFKEMKDTSLKNLKDVRAYTNLPVLSSIPLLENALLVRRKRRLFWLAWSSAVIVGTIAMSGSMYYYYFGRS